MYISKSILALWRRSGNVVFTCIRVVHTYKKGVVSIRVAFHCAGHHSFCGVRFGSVAGVYLRAQG
jgi:hypothetical protein